MFQHLVFLFGLRTAIVVGVLATAWQVSVAQQPISDQRTAAVDGILRNLIDTEMGWYGSSAQPQAAASNVAPKMNQARQTLRAFSNEAMLLINTLQNEARYSYEARLLLGDTMGVKASVDVLLQRSQYMADIQQIASDLSAFDGEWRVLSHRLRQSRNLGLAVARHVENLDGHSRQLASLLQLDPQMQIAELTQALAHLDAELEHLIRDVRVDLVNVPSQRQLDSDLQRLASWVRHLRSLVAAQRPYNDLKTQFKAFHDEWMPTKAKLRKIQNRHLQRSVTSVNGASERIQELLLMPRIIDGNDVLYMATVLKENVDLIGDQVSLRKLIMLPNATEVFNRMSEFYTLTGDFRQAVITKIKLEDLLWDFRVLEVAWTDLRETLGPLETPETIQQVAVVEASVADLRKALGIRSSVHRDEAMELASSLTNLTDLLHYDMSRFVGRGQYDAQFRSAAVNATSALRTSARAIQDSISSNASDAQVRQKCQELAQRWNQLQDYVARVSASDRTELVRTCQQISPMIAKLQVLYAYGS